MVHIHLIHTVHSSQIWLMSCPDLGLAEDTNLVFVSHHGSPNLHATNDFPVLPSWYGVTRVTQSFSAANEPVMKKKKRTLFFMVFISHSFLHWGTKEMPKKHLVRKAIYVSAFSWFLLALVGLYLDLWKRRHSAGDLTLGSYTTFLTVLTSYMLHFCLLQIHWLENFNVNNHSLSLSFYLIPFLPSHQRSNLAGSWS